MHETAWKLVTKWLRNMPSGDSLHVFLHFPIRFSMFHLLFRKFCGVLPMFSLVFLFVSYFSSYGNFAHDALFISWLLIVFSFSSWSLSHLHCQVYEKRNISFFPTFRESLFATNLSFIFLNSLFNVTSFAFLCSWKRFMSSANIIRFKSTVM